MIVCVASFTAGIAELSELAPRLVTISPRVVVEPRGLMWCDASGMDAGRVARGALELVRGDGESRDERTIADARAGVAQTPIAAEVAAISPHLSASGKRLTFVERGRDAEFLAAYPVEVLDPSAPLRTLLRGSGIERCGDLAALEHEAVEVRFGAEGSRLWRLARADDRRRLFPLRRQALPEASFEWLDYVLTEPERLLFVINGLMGSVCRQLAERGAGGREMALAFSLANRTTDEHRLRPARVTASQRAWMRLVRSELERIELRDAVSGISLSVISLGGELGRQGDLFDRGFASARATEEAVAQLLDDRGSALVVPRVSRHPLAAQRSEWVEVDATAAVAGACEPVAGRLEQCLPATDSQAPAGSPARPRLTLQLLNPPRAILAETERRRDHEIPVRCCLEDGWEDVTSAAGPDRVSGGEWESPFAREYYRCMTGSGRLVWIFREGAARWFLHGWWD